MQIPDDLELTDDELAVALNKILLDTVYSFKDRKRYAVWNLDDFLNDISECKEGPPC